jgi:hypothetical protein
MKQIAQKEQQGVNSRLNLYNLVFPNLEYQFSSLQLLWHLDVEDAHEIWIGVHHFIGGNAAINVGFYTSSPF